MRLGALLVDLLCGKPLEVLGHPVEAVVLAFGCHHQRNTCVAAGEVSDCGASRETLEKDEARNKKNQRSIITGANACAEASLPKQRAVGWARLRLVLGILVVIDLARHAHADLGGNIANTCSKLRCMQRRGTNACTGEKNARKSHRGSRSTCSGWARSEHPR
jgi:hypothetical protein